MDWVQFDVVEVQDGAAYESTVYDRDIVVRMGSGAVLKLFDMTPMITQQIEPGERLEAVVQVVADIHRGAYATLVENLTLNRSEWTGFRDNLLRGMWQRVKTSDGHLLVRESNLSATESRLGDGVSWDDARYDLMAWRKLEFTS